MEENKFNEEEFLKKVEKAAKDGVNKAGLKNALLSSLPTILIIALIAFLVIPKINLLFDGFKNIFNIDESVEGHDLTLNNHGIFGYTAADFEEAVLGDSSKLTKIEVFQQDISDVSTISDTGLFNLAVFSKNQLITYNGKVIYTVDLSKLSKNDIKVDQENATITIYIPHPEQEDINILEDQIQFSDTERGLLAIGEIKLAADKLYEIQSMARSKMQEKIDSQNLMATAERFAKLSVWEMYSPIIKSVAKNYSLEVEFKD